MRPRFLVPLGVLLGLVGCGDPRLPGLARPDGDSFPDAGVLALDGGMAADGGWALDGGAGADGGGGDGGPSSDGGEPDDGGGPDGGTLADGGQAADGGVLDGGLAADGGVTCDSRTVPPGGGCADDRFSPDSATEEWQHLSSAIIATLGSPNHRCLDLVYNPGQEQLLIGKFTYGFYDKDLKDEKVEIWIRVTCGQWVKFGSFFTSEEGEYGSVAGVEDDGGRVFFTIPQSMALGPGAYPVKMLVKGDHSEANCHLHVWRPGMHAVVSDIDGTITTSESDGLWTAFDPSSPEPHPSAPEAFGAYASKGYQIVYLTARPEFLTNGTRAWFTARGFPAGIFHLSETSLGEHGSAASDYKAAYLQTLTRDRAVHLDWAYGNRGTDLDAYLRAGIQPSRIYLFAYDGDLRGANRFDDYALEAARVRCLSPVHQP
jgi:hypothetical protein